MAKKERQIMTGKKKRYCDDVASTTDDQDPLVLYLNQISQYSLLSADDEKEIGKTCKDCAKELEQLIEKNIINPMDPDVFSRRSSELRAKIAENKNRMINSNLRLVVSVAKGYQYRGLGLLDLIAEGNLGLIEAVDRFDYSLGYRFSTYGTWWIRQAIIKSLADKSRVIRIPVHMLNTIKKCLITAKQLTQYLGHSPSDEELSGALDMPIDKIREIMALSQDTVSLDMPVDDDNMTRLSDLISDEKSKEQVDTVMTDMLHGTIQEVLDNFSERERRIIEMRFGLNESVPMTLEETGRAIGITRERVRQIQEKTMRKLSMNPKLKEFLL